MPHLDDQLFSQTPAAVGLSPQLYAVVTYGERVLTHSDLINQRVSARATWNYLGQGLAAGLQPYGIHRVFIRPARALAVRSTSPVASSIPTPPSFLVQLGVQGASPTGLLAHPHAFSLLNARLEDHYASRMAYAVLADGMAFAFPLKSFGVSKATALDDWLHTSTVALGRPLLSPDPLVYRDGFPRRTSTIDLLPKTCHASAQTR